MKIRLVSYSKATEEFNNEGILNVQDLIAFCARVSNPSCLLYTSQTPRDATI